MSKLVDKQIVMDRNKIMADHDAIFSGMDKNELYMTIDTTLDMSMHSVVEILRKAVSVKHDKATDRVLVAVLLDFLDMLEDETQDMDGNDPVFSIMTLILEKKISDDQEYQMKAFIGMIYMLISYLNAIIAVNDRWVLEDEKGK